MTPLYYPTSRHMARALEFIEQARKDNIAFYVEAVVGHHLSIVRGKEFTLRPAKCDVCHMPQPRGMRQFRYEKPRLVDGQACGKESFMFHPCVQCWSEIVQAVPMNSLIQSQHMGSAVVTNA